MRIAILAFVTTAFAATLAVTSPALGDNHPRHDRSVEMAAAKRAAEKIGELRGSIAPAQTTNAFFKEVEPVPLGFGLPLMIPQRGVDHTPPISFRMEFMDLAAARRW